MHIPKKKEIKDFQEKIRKDPVFFVEEVLKNPIWDKQKEILEAVRDNREVAIRSCHASGKSYISGRIVPWWLSAYKDSVVITTAPTFRQVKEVLWREVKGAIVGKNLFPENKILDTKIDLSEQWFALGLSTDKADQFQGFHSPHLLVLIDEASGIQPNIEEAIDGLTPEKIIRIGQPLSSVGRFADSFRMPGVKKMSISAFDTPNLTSEDDEVIIPGLITKEDVENFKIRYGEDSNVYRVRVLGEFPTQDADSLISINDVCKAMEREADVKDQFEKRMGVDVARFGNDRTVIIIRHMEKVTRKETFSTLDTMEIAGQVLRIAKEESVKAENIYIDTIGVGAGVFDRLREQHWPVSSVCVSESPQDKENYLNLRAELYADKLKEWLKTADLPEDDDFYELANIKYKFSSKGLLQIESKQDMKKRGLDSPDVADALMLTFADKKIINVPAQSQPLPGHYPTLGI